MNHMMSYDMMTGVPLLWILIGFLLGLLLAAVLTWLLAGRRNEQRFSQTQDTPQFQDSSRTYEQGYQSPELSPEMYQEGGQCYSYPQPQYEEPLTRYPQEMPLQQ